MPLYKYLCESCGNRFELLRSVTADDEGIHRPFCGAQAVTRQISAIAACGGSKESSDGWAG